MLGTTSITTSNDRDHNVGSIYLSVSILFQPLIWSIRNCATLMKDRFVSPFPNEALKVGADLSQIVKR